MLAAGLRSTTRASAISGQLDARSKRMLDEVADENRQLTDRVQELQDLLRAAQAECGALRTEVGRLEELRSDCDVCSGRCQKVGTRELEQPEAEECLSEEAFLHTSHDMYNHCIVEEHDEEDIESRRSSNAAECEVDKAVPTDDASLDWTAKLRAEVAAAEGARACAEEREALLTEAMGRLLATKTLAEVSRARGDREQQPAPEAPSPEKTQAEAPESAGQMSGTCPPSEPQAHRCECTGVLCLQILNETLQSQLAQARQDNLRMRMDSLQSLAKLGDPESPSKPTRPAGRPASRRPASSAGTSPTAAGDCGQQRPLTAPTGRLPADAISGAGKTEAGAHKAPPEGGPLGVPDGSEQQSRCSSAALGAAAPRTSSASPSLQEGSWRASLARHSVHAAPDRARPSREMARREPASPAQRASRMAQSPREEAGAQYFPIDAEDVDFGQSLFKNRREIVREMRCKLRGERLQRDRQLNSIFKPHVPQGRQSTPRPMSAAARLGRTSLRA